ncbi:DUF6101 family protein [Pelagibacterium luteolum]|uniref:Uncharacterized protein n=1 Tax=Pelagibacterium luteolum TaxID=440168 RepID=A0A1G7TZ90_9HYPH|nr:DUF6101 family protein [Pelagibacterium luteolum]SDG40583.1 hypothetical protein SAMN04487974_102442 [Pelagibacterium luteolum]
MVRGVTIDGLPSVLLTGTTYNTNCVFTPANDNGARQDAKTVTVRRKLDKSGVTVKIKVPVLEYVGVAVATRISEEGELTSSIELVHPDEDFNYRVYEESGNSDIVAEWQNWGRKLRLPLYIRAGDGSLVAYSQQIDGVMVGQNHSRRMLANEVERRPRFARRRKPGERTA